MPNFRKTRACIAYAYRNNFINEQEFAPLYDIHKFPHWNYERSWFWRENKPWMHGWVSFLQGGHLWTCWADAATWRDNNLQSLWFSGSFGTCISLQIWRFGFPVCKADSWAFQQTTWWKWFTVGGTTCLQDTITICSPFTSFSSMPTPYNKQELYWITAGDSTMELCVQFVNWKWSLTLFCETQNWGSLMLFKISHISST